MTAFNFSFLLLFFYTDSDRESLNNVERWTKSQLNAWESTLRKSDRDMNLVSRDRQTPFSISKTGWGRRRWRRRRWWRRNRIVSVNLLMKDFTLCAKSCLTGRPLLSAKFLTGRTLSSVKFLTVRLHSLTNLITEWTLGFMNYKIIYFNNIKRQRIICTICKQGWLKILHSFTTRHTNNWGTLDCESSLCCKQLSTSEIVIRQFIYPLFLKPL